MLKKIFFSLFFILIFFGAFSQKRELIHIGKINDSSSYFVKDKSAYLKKINDSLFSSKNIVKDIDIRKGITLGDKKEIYYYLQFTTDSIVYNRLLLNELDSLYIVNDNQEEFTVYDFYINCVGIDESCNARIFIIDKQYIWSCKDVLMCGPDSGCKSSITVF